MNENQTLQFKEEALLVNGERIICPAQDGERYIAIAPVCKILGIDLKSQKKVIKDHPLYRKGGVLITPQTGNNIPTEMIGINLKYFFGWLFGIHPNKVREDIRESLINYQEEICNVIYEKFVIQPQFEKLKVEAKLAKVNEIAELKENLKERQKEFKQIEGFLYDEFKANKMQLKIDF